MLEGVSADGWISQTVWLPVPYCRADHRKSPPTIAAETMARHDDVKICKRFLL